MSVPCLLNPCCSNCLLEGASMQRADGWESAARAFQPRGGRLQRAAQLEAVHTGSTRVSGPTSGHLALLLEEDAAIGRIHCSILQRYAHVAYTDGLRIERLGKLAKLGTWGKHQNHIQVEYWNLYLDVALEPPLVDKMPLLDPRAGEEHECDMPIMLPHIWFSSLWDHYRNEFFNKCAGTRERRADFWTGMHADDKRRDHHCFQRPNLLEKGVALALHGDGVPCTKDKSLDCTHMSSLMAEEGTTVDQCMILSAIWEHMKAAIP